MTSTAHPDYRWAPEGRTAVAQSLRTNRIPAAIGRQLPDAWVIAQLEEPPPGAYKMGHRLVFRIPSTSTKVQWYVADEDGDSGVWYTWLAVEGMLHQSGLRLRPLLALEANLTTIEEDPQARCHRYRLPLDSGNWPPLIVPADRGIRRQLRVHRSVVGGALVAIEHSGDGSRIACLTLAGPELRAVATALLQVADYEDRESVER